MLNRKIQKSNRFDADADVVFLLGDSLKTLKKIPDNSIQLIITSPPYNLQKEYETKQSLDADEFLEIIPTKLNEAVDMVWSGKITDVKTIIGILWAQRTLLNEI